MPGVRRRDAPVLSLIRRGRPGKGPAFSGRRVPWSRYVGVRPRAAQRRGG